MNQFDLLTLVDLFMPSWHCLLIIKGSQTQTQSKCYDNAMADNAIIAYYDRNIMYAKLPSMHGLPCIVNSNIIEVLSINSS